jgi:predicted phage terminase large subunit-like protein
MDEDDLDFAPVRKKSVEDYLNEVDYGEIERYTPSAFALEFVNFIKLVNEGSTENKTPVVHLRMIDNFIQDNGLDTINMCHRGIAKSTIKEYLILYIGVYGGLPNFGRIPYGLYVSDSMDNGIKKMRKALEYRHNNSSFLKQYIPTIKFTDIRWEFINIEGVSTVFSGHGAKTGVRGTRENNSRPMLALLDDLIDDADARSPTVIAQVEDTVYKAIDYALHPTKRKIIWSGTPFNAKDPLYKAVESGAWNVNIYPVCELFPCTKEDFRGSWEDRFPYEFVLKMYTKAKLSGKVADFNQEMMLRIMSEEDRLLEPHEIKWYSRDKLIKNKSLFNIYITTDFATSEKTSADFSVISVWALNSNGDWFWIDGVCKKQTMDKNIEDLFRLVQEYTPESVGIEVSGQQGGFIPWIQDQMLVRNCFFHIASDKKTNEPGIRPITDKYKRFTVVLPWFKLHKMNFPEEMKESAIMREAYNELTLATVHGFKSKHDDFIDTISMLAQLRTYKPSKMNATTDAGGNLMWDDIDGDDSANISSYVE